MQPSHTYPPSQVMVRQVSACLLTHIIQAESITQVWGYLGNNSPAKMPMPLGQVQLTDKPGPDLVGMGSLFAYCFCPRPGRWQCLSGNQNHKWWQVMGPNLLCQSQKLFAPTTTNWVKEIWRMLKVKAVAFTTTCLSAL